MKHKKTKTPTLQTIRQQWKSGKHPISFGGISTVKRYFPHASRKLIREALGGIDTYTLFREEKQPKPYNPIYVRNKRELLQSDLIDLRSIASQNDGMTFLLVVLDTFSRFAWIKPLKTKSAQEVLTAFKAIASSMPGGLGQQLMTDQGKEYINKPFQTWLQTQKVRMVVPNNKCPHVERFNRTFQNLLYKYMEEKESMRYIDALPGLVQLYNNRYHRIIKMSPFEAEQAHNYEKVLTNLEHYYESVEQKHDNIQPRFVIGDFVRISGHKTMFQKGYYQTFKPKLYQIAAIKDNLPVPMYKLKDAETGVEEAGTWYGNELQYVSKDYQDTLFKIESVIKERGKKGRNKEYFVKWKYWPESFNSWVPEKDMQDISG